MSKKLNPAPIQFRFIFEKCFYADIATAADYPVLFKYKGDPPLKR
jgi:hypothetical protein